MSTSLGPSVVPCPPGISLSSSHPDVLSFPPSLFHRCSYCLSLSSLSSLSLFHCCSVILPCRSLLLKAKPLESKRKSDRKSEQREMEGTWLQLLRSCTLHLLPTGCTIHSLSKSNGSFGPSSLRILDISLFCMMQVQDECHKWVKGCSKQMDYSLPTECCNAGTYHHSFFLPFFLFFLS